MKGRDESVAKKIVVIRPSERGDYDAIDALCLRGYTQMQTQTSPQRITDLGNYMKKDNQCAASRAETAILLVAAVLNSEPFKLGPVAITMKDPPKAKGLLRSMEAGSQRTCVIGMESLCGSGPLSQPSPIRDPKSAPTSKLGTGESPYVIMQGGFADALERAFKVSTRVPLTDEISVSTSATSTLGERRGSSILSTGLRRRYESEDGSSAQSCTGEERVVGCVTYAPQGCQWSMTSLEGEAEMRLLAVAKNEGPVASGLIHYCIKLAEAEGRSALHVLIPAMAEQSRRIYEGHGFKRNLSHDVVAADTGQELIALTYHLIHTEESRLHSRRKALAMIQSLKPYDHKCIPFSYEDEPLLSLSDWQMQPENAGTRRFAKKSHYFDSFFQHTAPVSDNEEDIQKCRDKTGWSVFKPSPETAGVPVRQK